MFLAYFSLSNLWLLSMGEIHLSHILGVLTHPLLSSTFDSFPQDSYPR